MQPRIDSITYTFRRGSPPRKLKAGDEKYVKGVLMVRQHQQSFGRNMVSNGRPVWEWVVWGSERDRNSERARYRTLRGGGIPHGLLVPDPPKGWKILESGRPIPAEHMTFVHGFGIDGVRGWFGPTPKLRGREAEVYGEMRAFAIPQTKNEILRDLFETSCTCKLRKRPVSESANVAVKKYMSRCRCEVKQGVIHASTQ
ncbi:hypothetical protein HOV23_gp063 [Pseudomonas phage Lana]|uniref:Uncharacterized protein n=1 Tax=Pseudomonas phage Lana TaxID=2530172 RepID=A0A481W6Y1_9CAUD|nr:hypothetical protein HOV23_gp063 [Pseudomonas phage Lana]QBJ04510.1 hypothetical protein [Pseudomonas phage Lana]